MHTRKLILILAIAALGAPATASAAFVHVVGPGESLSSVAAADGLSVYQLAAANGISSASQLTAGASLQIPPQSGDVSTPSDASSSSSADPVAPASESSSASSGGGGYTVQPGDTLSAIAARAGSSVDQLAADNGISADSLLIAGSSLQVPGQGGTVAAPVSSSASSAGGGYTVQPGDTLSAIAARAGTNVDQLASANGLDPAALLLAGTNISLSGGSSGASSGEPTSVLESQATSSGPNPTPQQVSASDVGSIAAEQGVSPSLAEAIGYQESGFNNDLVSSTGATGVMQIEPGTWDYIGQNLATPPPLSPNSATDNIRGGVLLLHSLLDQTGGDPAMAAAGYYQGLGSVREHGLYSDTQQYVNNVMALRQRFGG
jgi:LysM repeat protein